MVGVWFFMAFFLHNEKLRACKGKRYSMRESTKFLDFYTAVGNAMRFNGGHTFTRAYYDGGTFCLVSLKRIEGGREVWVNEDTMSGHQKLEARELMAVLERAFEAFVLSYHDCWHDVFRILPYCSCEVTWRSDEQRFRFMVGDVKAHHCELEMESFLLVTGRMFRQMGKLARSGPVELWHVYASGTPEAVPAVDDVDALVRLAVLRGFNGDPQNASAMVDHNAVAIKKSYQKETRHRAVAILEGGCG